MSLRLHISTVPVLPRYSKVAAKGGLVVYDGMKRSTRSILSISNVQMFKCLCNLKLGQIECYFNILLTVEVHWYWYVIYQPLKCAR